MNLEIAFAAGLYEQRIVLPQWFSRSSESGLRVDSEAMRRTDTGRRFRAYVTTGPLTLLTRASLFEVWQAQGPRSEWWLSAAAIILVERGMTFSYFIPTALKLMRAETLSASTPKDGGPVAELKLYPCGPYIRSMDCRAQDVFDTG